MCAFMGCCDNIPQICFKVAVTAFVVTAFVENKLKQGVCVCAFMGCCDSIPQICFKVAWTIFFQNKLKQGVCVCVFMGCCDSTPQCKSVEVFFLFLGAGGSTTALLETCLTRICVLFGAACASLKFQSHSIMITL